MLTARVYASQSVCLSVADLHIMDSLKYPQARKRMDPPHSRNHLLNTRLGAGGGGVWLEISCALAQKCNVKMNDEDEILEGVFV